MQMKCTNYKQSILLHAVSTHELITRFCFAGVINGTIILNIVLGDVSLATLHLIHLF